MASSRIIWNGNPGEVWVNNTGRLKYQLIVNYRNSCGLCIQYDKAISNWWPLPFHRNCRCRQCLVLIQGTAAPFVDFRNTLRGLSKLQQTEAIGRANFKLLESGAVKWETIVTPTRVRSLTEVIKDAGLSLKDLQAAGVRHDIAEAAYARVHTPRQTIIREQRVAMVTRIIGAGISPQQLKEAVAQGVAEKIGIAAGPSKASPVKSVNRPGTLPEKLRGMLAYFGRKVQAMLPFKKPEPPKAPDAKPPDSTGGNP